MAFIVSPVRPNVFFISEGGGLVDIKHLVGFLNLNRKKRRTPPLSQPHDHAAQDLGTLDSWHTRALSTRTYLQRKTHVLP